MYNIDDHLGFLLAALKESVEYKRYKEPLEEVKKDPELLNRMHEYQRSRFQIHVEPDDRIAEEDRTLRLKYSELLANPLVDAHLKAEKKYCKLVRRIEDSFSEGAGIDVSFLEE